jgi:hypothetical protein
MSGSWSFSRHSQARISGAVRPEGAPRFPPSILLSIDGQPAFIVPTRPDEAAHGGYLFEAVLGSWVPPSGEALTLSAPGTEPVTLALSELAPEAPLLRSHIDCVTARSILGWGFWTEEGAPIRAFEAFVDFLPVEITVRRWRREDLAATHGTEQEICFELGFPADLNGATVSIRADGACALFKTAVRPTYFLGEVKRLHRGAIAVVGVSPVHESGARLLGGGRAFPQLTYPSALGVGGDGAAYFAIPSDLADDRAACLSVSLRSNPAELYPVSRT